MGGIRAQDGRGHEGKGPKDPGVAAPLTAAGCRGNWWYDSLRHTFLAYVSVLVSLFSVGFLAEEDRGRQTGIVMNSCSGVQCDEHLTRIPTEQGTRVISIVSCGSQ